MGELCEECCLDKRRQKCICVTIEFYFALWHGEGFLWYLETDTLSATLPRFYNRPYHGFRRHFDG